MKTIGQLIIETQFPMNISVMYASGNHKCRIPKTGVQFPLNQQISNHTHKSVCTTNIPIISDPWMQTRIPRISAHVNIWNTRTHTHTHTHTQISKTRIHTHAHKFQDLDSHTHIQISKTFDSHTTTHMWHHSTLIRWQHVCWWLGSYNRWRNVGCSEFESTPIRTRCAMTFCCGMLKLNRCIDGYWSLISRWYALAIVDLVVIRTSIVFFQCNLSMRTRSARWPYMNAASRSYIWQWLLFVVQVNPSIQHQQHIYVMPTPRHTSSLTHMSRTHFHINSYEQHILINCHEPDTHSH